MMSSADNNSGQISGPTSNSTNSIVVRENPEQLYDEKLASLQKYIGPLVKLISILEQSEQKPLVHRFKKLCLILAKQRIATIEFLEKCESALQKFIQFVPIATVVHQQPQPPNGSTDGPIPVLNPDQQQTDNFMIQNVPLVNEEEEVRKLLYAAEYAEKLTDLQKFVEPLRNLISLLEQDPERVGQVQAVKNMYNILTHQTIVPLQCLYSYEKALERIDRELGLPRNIPALAA